MDLVLFKVVWDMTVYVGIILLPTCSHDQTKKAFDWVNKMLTKSWYR